MLAKQESESRTQVQILSTAPKIYMTKRKVEKQAVPTWGKMLTRVELLALLAKLDAKKKEREMSKLSDTLARALAKKQGRTPVDSSDAAATVEKKVRVKSAAPVGKKPPTRSAGRGR